MRMQVGEDEWRNISIFAIPDYKDLRLNKVTSESGAWPPPSTRYNRTLGARSGECTRRRHRHDQTPKNKIRELRVAG